MIDDTVRSDKSFSAFDIVAVAASTGGVEALGILLAALPADFPAIVTVVQHVGARVSVLPEILGYRCAMPVRHAERDEILRAGVVYVAPPDRHLFITRDGRAEVSSSPRVQFTRPAADPMLVSAAGAYGRRALAVVLTGANTDGTAGVQAIKWLGGMVLAQDPASCKAHSMPQSAIATGCVDLVLPIAALGHAVTALVMARGAAEFLRVPLHAA